MTNRSSEGAKEDNSKRQADQSVKKLLDRLEQKEDDQVAIITLNGRALSRSSNNNLHLATAGGIVAVPIANIKQVIQLSDSDPEAVSLVVRNPQDIKPLLGVKPAKPFPIEGFGTNEIARIGDHVTTDRTHREKMGVGTYTVTETDTITGLHGETDQCDDNESGPVTPDDLNE